MKPRHRFSKRVAQVALPAVEGEGAKQSFKEECDINNIMRKFIKTGVLTHVNRHEPMYGAVPSQTYHEAMEVIRHAQEMFAEIPAAVRKKFGNDPEAFLAFVSSEENIAEMRKLGILKPEQVKVKDPIEILGDRIEAAMAKPPKGKAAEPPAQ